jgi:hypothetical protein
MIMKKSTLLLFFLVLGISAFSQKKVLLEDKDQIIERAKLELDSAMMAPEGALYLWAQKNPIQGEFVFDISIWEKGTVTSIYVVANNGGTIDAQNRFKAFLMDFKFNFKMPKGKSYKFRHAFVFN